MKRRKFIKSTLATIAGIGAVLAVKPQGFPVVGHPVVAFEYDTIEFDSENYCKLGKLWSFTNKGVEKYYIDHKGEFHIS